MPAKLPPKGRGRRGGGGCAAPGTLSEDVVFWLRQLILLHQFRQRAARGLVGRHIVLSEARALLVWNVLLDFAAGRVLSLAAAQDRLAAVASETTVRNEVALLEELGVVVVERTGSGRARRTTIWPSERTVRWYNRHFLTGVRHLLRAVDQWRASKAR